MDAKKFGAYISQRRKEQHMTQADLAGKIGVTDKAVSRWERGLGFPDINTMEPLADALGLSLLELMRSETNKKDVTEKNSDVAEEKQYTSAEVTEMMHSMEEIRKQQQHQDKIAGYLAVPVILMVTILFRLTGNANLGGGIFAGLIGAGAVVCGYYLWENREDGESRKVYGFFTIVLTGLFLTLCSFWIPDGFWEQHQQGASLINCLMSLVIYGCVFDRLLKRMYREKKNPVAIVFVAVLTILIQAYTLHSFAARSIENAMGTSKGDVAEQYAVQLLIGEKDLEEDWIRGYSYVQTELHPDVYRVGFSYYADQKDAENGKESVYGYDMQVDSDYKITIKEESTAIGEELWSEKTEEADTEDAVNEG